MRVDPVRATRAAAVGAWATLFVWLYFSGEAVNYVGPRTAWVVPFGATVLVVTAVALALTSRSSGPVRRPSPRELSGLTALIAPVLVLLVIPNPGLGALAAENKSAENSAAYASTDVAAEEILGLAETAAAIKSKEYARSQSIGPGRLFEAVALVTAKQGGSLSISRFMVSCCAADGIPYTVQVRAEPSMLSGFEKNDWVLVRGQLRRGAGGKLEVRASSVASEPTPNNPYITG